MKKGCGIFNIYIGLILIALGAGGTAISNYKFKNLPSLPLDITVPVAAADSSPRKVPIITYHIVRPAYDSDTPDITEYATTPEMFDKELSYLDEQGFNVISLDDLIDYLNNGTALPTKPIVITLDDGWRSQYQYAFPLLEKHHDTATFFVFTNAIGNPHYFSWDELKEMQSAGMSIGSHSRTHPYLTTIQDDAQLRDEIFTSKKILEDHLGKAVTAFAYPFGSYTDHIIDLLKEAGYQAARSEDYGVVQSKEHIFTLKTINANGNFNEFVHALSQ